MHDVCTLSSPYPAIFNQGNWVPSVQRRQANIRGEAWEQTDSTSVDDGEGESAEENTKCDWTELYTIQWEVLEEKEATGVKEEEIVDEVGNEEEGMVQMIIWSTM